MSPEAVKIAGYGLQIEWTSRDQHEVEWFHSQGQQQCYSLRQRLVVLGMPGLYKGSCG